MIEDRKLVSVVMGSESDLVYMRAAGVVLRELSVSFEVTIVSAHRTPGRLVEYARGLIDSGVSIVIAGAGGAGMIASMTTVPVIGVPIALANLSGMDSLLSIRGVPVACMAINGAENAAMLGISDVELRERLTQRMNDKQHEVEEAALSLERDGWELH